MLQDVIGALYEAMILSALPIGAILFTMWSFRHDRENLHDLGTRHLRYRD